MIRYQKYEGKKAIPTVSTIAICAKKTFLSLRGALEIRNNQLIFSVESSASSSSSHFSKIFNIVLIEKRGNLKTHANSHRNHKEFFSSRTNCQPNIHTYLLSSFMREPFFFTPGIILTKISGYFGCCKGITVVRGRSKTRGAHKKHFISHTILPSSLSPPATFFDDQIPP